VDFTSNLLFKQMLSNTDGDNIYEIQAKPEWKTYKDAAMELFDKGATLLSDGSSLDVARRHKENIPEGAKLFIICDDETYRKIVG